MDKQYVQILADVQALSRDELLQEVREWQLTLCRPTAKQAAGWAQMPTSELRGRVVRIRAHEGLDAAGRQRVNQELEGQRVLQWVGKPGALLGYWVPAQG